MTTHAQGVVERLRGTIDIRLNNYLIEMKPNYDDSITGFNEAWDIVTKAFNEAVAAASLARPVEGLETTEEERESIKQDALKGVFRRPTAWLLKLLRDHATLTTWVQKAKAREIDDAITISRLTSGKELQLVMQMHNATLGHAEALEAALREEKIANVDLAIATAKQRAEAMNILRVAAQRAQSTLGSESDIRAIYHEINTAIGVLDAALSSGKET